MEAAAAAAAVVVGGGVGATRLLSLSQPPSLGSKELQADRYYQ